MTSSISFPELQSAIRGREPPSVIDVRKQPAFRAATDMIAGALRRDPESELRRHCVRGYGKHDDPVGNLGVSFGSLAADRYAARPGRHVVGHCFQFGRWRGVSCPAPCIRGARWRTCLTRITG